MKPNKSLHRSDRTVDLRRDKEMSCDQASADTVFSDIVSRFGEAGELTLQEFTKTLMNKGDKSSVDDL
ncbi:MAG: hypothetical protein ACYS1A_02815 [Planctomycetota bacterium]|jgi:hypothetical protein